MHFKGLVHTAMVHCTRRRPGGACPACSEEQMPLPSGTARVHDAVRALTLRNVRWAAAGALASSSALSA